MRRAMPAGHPSGWPPSPAANRASVLTREAIERLAENALRMAKLAPPDPYAGIADPDQLATEIPELDLAANDLPDPKRLEELALQPDRPNAQWRCSSTAPTAG